MTETHLEIEILRGQLRAVKALDDWARASVLRSWLIVWDGTGCWCTLYDANGRSRRYHGESPEAARANAAEAVRADGPDSEPMTSAERAVRPTDGSD